LLTFLADSLQTVCATIHAMEYRKKITIAIVVMAGIAVVYAIVDRFAGYDIVKIQQDVYRINRATGVREISTSSGWVKD